MAEVARSRNPRFKPASNDIAGGYVVVSRTGPCCISISAANSSPPTVRNAKADAVCPAVEPAIPPPFLRLRDFSTDHGSNSSSSRSSCVEARRASCRCSAEQYCWSASDRRKPIFLPQRKQSRVILVALAPILTRVTHGSAVLGEELLRACFPSRIVLRCIIDLNREIAFSASWYTPTIPSRNRVRIPIKDVLDLHTVSPRDVKAVVEEYLA